MSDCPYGDSHCPCQDGDACHYEETETTPAWPPPGEEHAPDPHLEPDGSTSWEHEGDETRVHPRPSGETQTFPRPS